MSDTSPLELLNSLAGSPHTSTPTLIRCAAAARTAPGEDDLRTSVLARLAADPRLPYDTARGLAEMGEERPRWEVFYRLFDRADLDDDRLDDLLGWVERRPAGGRDAVLGEILSFRLAKPVRVRVRAATVAARYPSLRPIIGRMLRSPDLVPDDAVAVISALAGAEELDDPDLTRTLWGIEFDTIRPELLDFAYDHVEHLPFLLAVSDLPGKTLTASQIERLAQVAVLNPPQAERARPYRSWDVAEALEVLDRNASQALRLRCAAACESAAAGGFRLDDTVLTTTRSGHLDTPQQLTAVVEMVNGLTSEQWTVFLALADTFTGTFAELRDVCVDTSVSPAISVPAPAPDELRSADEAGPGWH